MEVRFASHMPSDKQRQRQGHHEKKRSKPQVQQLERLVVAARVRQLQRDDRYIILPAKRGQRQSTSVISQQLSTARGRQVSRFTVARRLHKGVLFAHRSERCLSLKVDHRRHRLQWCREHKNWTTDQRSRVLFTDESRFSTRSDSLRVLIWREFGTRFYTSNIKERHHYAGPGVLVWGSIKLNGRSELHIFDMVCNRGSLL
ncbi:transposable element Tcb2 transposase [Trichonephila clavipes]|nr:transposable element Tcb2 transposase [Trichonephila clavipes]